MLAIINCADVVLFMSYNIISILLCSDVLESQVRRLQPHLHLYGHTHIPLGGYCVYIICAAICCVVCF